MTFSGLPARQVSVLPLRQLPLRGAVGGDGGGGGDAMAGVAAAVRRSGARGERRCGRREADYHGGCGGTGGCGEACRHVGARPRRGRCRSAAGQAGKVGAVVHAGVQVDERPTRKRRRGAAGGRLGGGGALRALRLRQCARASAGGGSAQSWKESKAAPNEDVFVRERGEKNIGGGRKGSPMDRHNAARRAGG